ncbi:MAG: hypothetical protein AAF901_14915, partial [Bacteroidota bacterium]
MATKYQGALSTIGRLLPMNHDAQKYYVLICILGVGKGIGPLTREGAQTFFKLHFDVDMIVHSYIQRQLIDWMRSGTDGKFIQAEENLRCIISNEMKQFCKELENRYGEKHRISADEILYLVLDPVPLNRTFQKSNSQNYESLTNKILKTFNPDKAQLSTWTNWLVKTDREVKFYFREHGLEFSTTWQLLYRTTPGELFNMMTGRYTASEIEQASTLLLAFQQIYIRPINQRRYSEPTESQLAKMVPYLPSEIQPSI